MKKLLIVILVLLLFSGCNQNKRQIKDTVTAYTTLLAQGYRNLNMNPLIQVATEERATKAYHYMAALGEARVKMDARLKNLKFLDIKIHGFLKGEKAEVKTEEIWDYSYINIDRGEQVFDNSVTYELTYALIKKSDQWLVADITIEKAAEKKSPPDWFQRPKLEPSNKR